MIQNVCVPSGNWDCRFDQTISERKKQELIIVGAWSGRGPAVVRPNFGVVRVFFAVERLNFAVVPGTPKIAQNDNKMNLGNMLSNKNTYECILWKSYRAIARWERNYVIQLINSTSLHAALGIWWSKM